jgi:hypothetical protein
MHCNDESFASFTAVYLPRHSGIRLLDRRGGRGMTTEQFNELVREDIRRMMPRRFHHFVFEWDRATGFSCDRINYGPIDVTASTWIVPGTIEEEEPYPEADDDEL